MVVPLGLLFQVAGEFSAGSWESVPQRLVDRPISYQTTVVAEGRHVAVGVDCLMDPYDWQVVCETATTGGVVIDRWRAIYIGGEFYRLDDF